jgi:hypothetical protein
LYSRSEQCIVFNQQYSQFATLILRQRIPMLRKCSDSTRFMGGSHVTERQLMLHGQKFP